MGAVANVVVVAAVRETAGEDGASPDGDFVVAGGDVIACCCNSTCCCCDCR